ncbi:MAG TPA: hypothetical protein VFN61_12975 [Acidimicrobiales bacterium]|nr:hypothetical protein [Acidimicrobiales bacterium]
MRTEDRVGMQPELHLVLPANWRTVPLSGQASDRAVLAMMRSGLGTSASKSAQRQAVFQAYREMLRQAREAGAVFAATYAEMVDGGPLAATVIAFFGLLPEGARSSPGVAAHLLAGLAAGPAAPVGLPPASLARVGTAEAVRTIQRQPVPGWAGTGAAPEIETVHYYTPLVPDDRMLVLAFSTPSTWAAEAFRALFDQIALSARLRGLSPG